ncbi:MAG: hypothetical protein HKN85_08100 [Gammaproteobacteria bacterium]|nr:hypothetical protein [Gammaproteobacteria bacterium]
MFVKISMAFGWALLALFMGGCAQNFVVTGDYPKPLIESTPIMAKMHFSEEFMTYKYLEKGEDRSLQSVDFGVAQVQLFNRIFGSLFNLVEDDQQTADINIEPHVLDFQYSAPRETKLKLFEVWLKYRLRITDAEDQEIADWVVKGYGKTPTSLLSSNLKAFNIATVIALRDVGAQLAIGFRSQPSIAAFLSQRSDQKLAAEPPATPLAESEQMPTQRPPKSASQDSPLSADKPLNQLVGGTP